MGTPTDTTMDMKLSEATQILVAHRVRGLANRESVRRAMLDGKIPYERVEVGSVSRYWVSSAAVGALLNNHRASNEDGPSVDRQLLDHFAEAPTNDAVSAVRAGITRSLLYAQRIFRAYQASVNSPAALAEKERLAREAYKQWESEKSAEPPCPLCHRPYLVARKQTADLVREVTGEDRGPLARFTSEEGDAFFGLELREWQCRCGTWRLGAPIEIMRERLRAARVAARR